MFISEATKDFLGGLTHVALIDLCSPLQASDVATEIKRKLEKQEKKRKKREKKQALPENGDANGDAEVNEHSFQKRLCMLSFDI